MALTQEAIKALDKRALELELAVQLFRFQWWAKKGQEERGKELLSAGNAAIYKHHDDGNGIWDAETLAGIPLSTRWDREVNRWTQTDNDFAVRFEMEMLGWYWYSDVRTLDVKKGEETIERFTGFRRWKRDKKGYTVNVWTRTMPCAGLVDLSVATCQAALWTLQPWENESWKG
jgi:hypothetical protein